MPRGGFHHKCPSCQMQKARIEQTRVNKKYGKLWTMACSSCGYRWVRRVMDLYPLVKKKQFRDADTDRIAKQ